MDGIVLSGKFSKALLDKNIKTWVGKGVMKTASLQPYYKMLAYHTPTDEELVSEMDGIERGELVEVPENGRYSEETDLPGFRTTWMQKNFGRIKSISKVAGRADASGHRQKTQEKLARSLGDGYMKALNRSVLDIIRNGFNTSYTSYGNGKPFFSTIHTRIDGGDTTYRSNASSTGLVLNYENLKAAKLALLGNSVDGGGEVIDYNHKPLDLIVAPSEEDDALEAVGEAKHLFATNTGNNTPNVHQMQSRIRIVVVPGLGTAGGGTDGRWYLKVSDLGDEEPIRVLHRQGLETESEKDFETKKYKVSADASWATGWTDPIGKFWGSKGDGAGYSS